MWSCMTNASHIEKLSLQYLEIPGVFQTKVLWRFISIMLHKFPFHYSIWQLNNSLKIIFKQAVIHVTQTGTHLVLLSTSLVLFDDKDAPKMLSWQLNSYMIKSPAGPRDGVSGTPGASGNCVIFPSYCSVFNLLS